MEAAFTLVEVMIVVGVIALLTAVAIPNLLRARMLANDAIAQATLKSIGRSIETYRLTNDAYPASVDTLTDATPPYLNEDYFAGTRSGFVYENTVDTGSYTITATPAALGRTGSTTFTITTGGVLTP